MTDKEKEEIRKKIHDDEYEEKAIECIADFLYRIGII